MSTLITIHGFIRWFSVVLALVLIARYVWGWLGKRPFTTLDRQLGIALAGVVTVQFALGVINLVWLLTLGAFRPGTHIEHAFYGFVATGLVHSLPALKRLPDAQRFRNGLFLVLLALAIILLSVIRLRGSFFFG